MDLWLYAAKDSTRETFVNGLASVQPVAPGVVCVSYYAERESPATGKTERRIVSKLLWDIGQFAEH